MTPVAEPVNRGRRTLTGLGLIIGGALLGMLAMTALPWYRGSLGGFFVFGTTVSDLRQTIAFYQSAKDIYGVIDYGLSPIYFRWLAIAVLILAALLAASTLGFDGRASRIAGIVASVVALAGVVLTALSIQVVDIDAARLERATNTPSNPPEYLDFVRATSFGAWAMVVAFVAIGVGAQLAHGGRDAMRDVLDGDVVDDADGDADGDVDGDVDGDQELTGEAKADKPVESASQTQSERENW